MEAIRNYLESMFANLPNTAEVQKAKSELLQMMEDKYTSLIEEGKKENEAVGIVISEFGNLDEIAETLGISHVTVSSSDAERRHVSREEASQYVIDRNRYSFLIGLGVLLCIISPIFPIIFSGILSSDAGDAIGASGLFLSVAAAVGIFIYASSTMKKWEFIKKCPCSIDYQTADELYQEKKVNQSTKTLFLIIGVLLCIVSVIPCIISDALPLGLAFSDIFSPVLLFIMVGIGVMLIIFSSGRDGAYGTLLGLNNRDTVSGNYESTRSGSQVYKNPKLNTIMSVYWHTVRCLYLIWSFLTFRWYITWIIWPIAAIIHFIIKSAYREEA